MREQSGKPYTAAQRRQSEDVIELRSFSEVADIWFARTGQRLTPHHVRCIVSVATRKLRVALRDKPT